MSASWAGEQKYGREGEQDEQHQAVFDHADWAVLRLASSLVEQLMPEGKRQEEPRQQGCKAEQRQVRGSWAVFVFG